MTSAEGAQPGPTAAAILVGGQSRRFGSPKALARVAGHTLLDRALHAVRTADLTPLLVGRAGSLEYEGAVALTWLDDAEGLHGPAAGVLAALEWADRRGAPGLLVLGCDQPLLTAAPLRHLVSRARLSPELAAWFRTEHGPEPLPAYYPVSLIEPLRNMAAGDGGGPSLQALLGLAGDQGSAVVLTTTDPWRHELRGANTPEQLDALARRLEDRA